MDMALEQEILQDDPIWYKNKYRKPNTTSFHSIDDIHLWIVKDFDGPLASHYFLRLYLWDDMGFDYTIQITF